MTNYLQNNAFSQTVTQSRFVIDVFTIDSDDLITSWNHTAIYRRNSEINKEKKKKKKEKNRKKRKKSVTPSNADGSKQVITYKLEWNWIKHDWISIEANWGVELPVTMMVRISAAESWLIMAVLSGLRRFSSTTKPTTFNAIQLNEMYVTIPFVKLKFPCSKTYFMCFLVLNFCAFTWDSDTLFYLTLFEVFQNVIYEVSFLFEFIRFFFNS